MSYKDRLSIEQRKRLLEREFDLTGLAAQEEERLEIEYDKVSHYMTYKKFVKNQIENEKKSNTLNTQRIFILKKILTNKNKSLEELEAIFEEMEEIY